MVLDVLVLPMDEVVDEEEEEGDSTSISKKCALHCGTKPGRFETSYYSFSHKLGSGASEQMSVAERASASSSAEPANK